MNHGSRYAGHQTEEGPQVSWVHPERAWYGDELITLSTCEYTYENGRFVVVAKKIVE